MDYTDKSQRFQNQTWYVKLWRFRFYLLIPFQTVMIFFNSLIYEEKEHRVSFRNCWSLSIGLAQVEMNWTYDWDEVKASLKWLEDCDELDDEDGYGNL